MTEKLPPLSTQIVPPSQSAFLPGSVIPAHDVSQEAEPVEEEPYTIKCICNFSDDDGNTVYCETCDTWQHIECFYPNNVKDASREDFVHSCAECMPRPLDRQQAFERQRARLSSLSIVEDATDKKTTKRPPSKSSHKKKPKPTDLQLNGHSATDPTKQSLSHEHAPTKKTKSSHKTTHSISSQAAKRSPPHGTGRTSISHTHPPSPATTPPDLPSDLEIHGYSPGFIALHRDNHVHSVNNHAHGEPTNSFASLNISTTMSLWLRDHKTLLQQTGQEFGDVFQALPPDAETLKPHPVNVRNKNVPLIQDTVRWYYLTTRTAVEKDVPLIELNGLIGFQSEYSEDKRNRWEEFSSPLPFVFFHEMLPLYIDTRNEGSLARYVRRSCRPNAVIDTFLSEDSEYHFWIVSDRPIAANERITIAWDFRFPKKEKARMLHLLGLGDDDSKSHDEQEMDDTEYQNISSWLHLILSEYGGCACELGSDCAFVRFHRNYLARSQARNSTTKKRPRKPKTHAISPTSTGQATNSRAASEGRLDDGLEADTGSASGSSRSKPPSRDMTPAPRQGSFDTLGILTEPTDRDKRKVAMVEDTFRRMEQNQPPRKKKRVSDSTPSNSSSKPKIKASAGIGHGPNYVDAGTSHSKSGSPSSATSPVIPDVFKRSAVSRHSPVGGAHRSVSSLPPHSNYCDAAVQTDAVEGEWYSGSSQTPRPRRVVVSLSKRLLENRHRIRQEEEEKRKKKRESLDSQSATSEPMIADLTLTDTKPLPSPPATTPTAETEDGVTGAPEPAPVDTPMPDAPLSPSSIKPPEASVSEAGAGAGAGAGADAGADNCADIRAGVPSNPSKQKSPELRVQLPPVPVFNGTVPYMSVANTPLSATGSIVQSPFSVINPTSPFPPGSTGNTVAPSPVKKKLSLSDYTKSRKAAASRPSIGTTLKTSPLNSEDPKSATSVDGPNMADSPSMEKATELLGSIPETPVNGTSV